MSETSNWPIRLEGDPILRAKALDFNFEESDGEKFAAIMQEAFEEANGPLGLAAPQIGIDRRIIAITAFPHPDVLFNPTITWASDEKVTMDEGCLSFPGLTLTVSRPKSIRIRFQDMTGQWLTGTVGGMTARIIQHEIDHLDGILFVDHVSRAKLALARRKKIK